MKQFVRYFEIACVPEIHYVVFFELVSPIASFFGTCLVGLVVWEHNLGNAG